MKWKDLTTGNLEEEDEKQRLIERVLELQSTLDDLSKKVSEVSLRGIAFYIFYTYFFF